MSAKGIKRLERLSTRDSHGLTERELAVRNVYRSASNALMCLSVARMRARGTDELAKDMKKMIKPQERRLKKAIEDLAGLVVHDSDGQLVMLVERARSSAKQIVAQEVRRHMLNQQIDEHYAQHQAALGDLADLALAGRRKSRELSIRFEADGGVKIAGSAIAKRGAR